MEGQGANKRQVCLMLSESAIQRIQFISDTLGIPMSVVVEKALEDPRALAVLEDAARQLSALEGAKEEQGGGS